MSIAAATIPGDGAFMNASVKCFLILRERAFEIFALFFDRLGRGVAHGAGRFGRVRQIDLDPREVRSLERDEARIVNEVAHDWALAASGEARHPMLDVGEEALAALLAVVADVDASFELLGDHMAGRFGDHLVERALVDRLMAAFLAEHF